MKTSNFKYYFKLLYTPSVWGQNESYSKEWDIELNRCLDKYEFSDLAEDGYTVHLGPHRLWIANRWYCAFMPKPEFEFLKFRASRITIIKAIEKFNKTFGNINSTDYAAHEYLNSIDGLLLKNNLSKI